MREDVFNGSTRSKLNASTRNIRPQPAATSTVNEIQHTTETGKSEVGSGRTKMGCGQQKIDRVDTICNKMK